MKEEDEEHTSFITPYGVFCYRTMPFGLKNVGATYQRMMQACLRDQIGRKSNSMSTTSSSIPTAQARYSTTSAKPLQHSTNTESSSTQKCACSASQPENCSYTWSLP